MEIKRGNRAHQLLALLVPCPSKTAWTIVWTSFALSPGESQVEICCLVGGDICRSSIHIIQVASVLLEGQIIKERTCEATERCTFMFLKAEGEPKVGECGKADLHHVLMGVSALSPGLHQHLNKCHFYKALSFIYCHRFSVP